MAADSPKLCHSAIVLGCMLIAVVPSISAADTAPIAVAVIDLDYVDTSGEVRDQRQEHAARIARFSEALRADLSRGGKFRVVTLRCDAGAVLVRRAAVRVADARP